MHTRTARFGKSFTAKHVISALVKQGKRIGIMSNSHAAILHLLTSVIKELPDSNIAKVGRFKTQTAFKDVYPEEQYLNFDWRNSLCVC